MECLYSHNNYVKRSLLYNKNITEYIKRIINQLKIINFKNNKLFLRINNNKFDLKKNNLN